MLEKHKDIDKIVRKTLFKRTYPIDESHFEKLEEYGFLERTEDGYVTSDLFKEWVRENTKFWLPALTVMAAGLFADPFGYGKPMTLGGMAWLLFGHNYIECKSGEEVTDLVEKYREEVL